MPPAPYFEDIDDASDTFGVGGLGLLQTLPPFADALFVLHHQQVSRDALDRVLNATPDGTTLVWPVRWDVGFDDAFELRRWSLKGIFNFVYKTGSTQQVILEPEVLDTTTLNRTGRYVLEFTLTETA